MHTTTSRRSPRARPASTSCPDGSTYAFFNTFILFSDVNSLVCNLIAPPTGGMSFLQPIQQALAGSGSAFNCSSELSTFNALQGGSTPATASTPQPTAGATSGATNAGAAAANQAYGIVGQPDQSTPTTVGGIISQLLGGSL